jgi:outer membrane receptor protein involved in Fe transport
MTIVPISGHRRSVLARSLALALVLPMSMSAMAQDAAEDEDEEEQTSSEAATLDRVTVVGSRINRAEVEGPAPVIVISREDIEREGFQTVADALQTLTQNTTSSFTGDLGVTGFTPNAQVVNLRNLGPGYTLTLINGRRPAQYPQPYNRDNNVVNLRAIPSAIIERVEVLTGGASAIYGSDAVAGVVNIVLRRGFEGHQVRGSVGTTGDGGGDNVNFEFTGGQSGDRWSTTYAFQYGSSDPVFGTQRDYLADTRNNPYGTVPNPALSLVVINAAGPNANRNALYDAAACDAFGYTTVTTAARGTYCGSFTQPGSRTISNSREYVTGYNYTTFDITDTLQFFAAGTFYSQDAKASAGTEFWGTSGDRFNVRSNGATTAFYYDPQFGNFVQLQRVFNPFELGGAEAATTLFDEQTYDITLGLSGNFADRFDWEAAVMHSKYEYTQDRPRLLAQAVHDYFLGPSLGFVSTYSVNELNIDRWNTPITPEIYRSFSTRVINEAESESSTFNFSVNGDLFELPAGAVGFAGVLEAGRQSTDLRSDPRTNPLRPADEQTVYNLVSSGRTEGERDRFAAGVEFRVPIFESLTANAAARYDKYDDITQVDDAITYQLGLEYRPFDSLLLRGSYATSFRAPDMQLVYAEGAASFSTVLDEYSCRSGTGPGATLGPRNFNDCNVSGDPTLGSAQTRIAGNPLLKEEEGTSWGAGFVWDIAERMSLSVDYYNINLQDAASQLSSGYILEQEANCRLGVDRQGNPFQNDINSTFCQNILSLITRSQTPGGTVDDTRVDAINSAYINTAEQETSGIDATYRYSFGTERFGDFAIDLGYSLVLTNKYKEFEDEDLIDYRDRPLFDYSQRSRARGSVSWGYGTWSTQLTGIRYGSNWNASWTSRLAPYMVYNATVVKRFTDNLSADFTVQNLFDNQFRYDPAQTGYPYYNPWIGADPLGRRYNLRLTYRF